MRKVASTVFAVILLTGVLTGHDAVAQTPPAGGSSGTSGNAGAATNPDFQSYQDQKDREDEMFLRKVMALTRDKAKAAEETRELIEKVKLSCKMTTAYIVGVGKREEDGRSMDTKIYETTCENGVGYLLETQGEHEPRVVSCFAAAASHASEGEKERQSENSESSFYCQLKANKDIRAAASSLIKPFAPTCEVNDVRWLGITSTQKTEYTEVLCADHEGYILEIPRFNSSASVLAVNCQEAGELGLQCHLSKSAPPPQPITMKTYLDALKENGLNCEPVQLRVIGREHDKKRYVVEVQCLDHPQGIVAYLPLKGNSSKFETIDCNAALKRNIHCKFVAKH